MIRSGYNQPVEPPAPFVHRTLRCREAGKEIANLPAQLDSAADRTVIPSQLVDELGLVLLDELPVSGFGGQVFLIPSYGWNWPFATSSRRYSTSLPTLRNPSFSSAAMF